MSKSLPGGVRGQQRNPSHVALQNPEKKEELSGKRNRQVTELGTRPSMHLKNTPFECWVKP